MLLGPLQLFLLPLAFGRPAGIARRFPSQTLGMGPLLVFETSLLLVASGCGGRAACRVAGSPFFPALLIFLRLLLTRGRLL